MSSNGGDGGSLGVPLLQKRQGAESSPQWHASQQHVIAGQSVTVTPDVVAADGSDLEDGVDGQLPMLSIPTLMGRVAYSSIPAALSFALEFLSTLVAMRFVGQYKHSEHLAGAGLAMLWADITLGSAYGVLMAMASLIPAAVGDGNNRMVGAVLQRSVVVATLLSIVVALIWVPAPAFFRAIGQHKHAADSAETFLNWHMLGIWPTCMYYAFQLFLQGQNIWWPAVGVLLSSNVLLYWVSEWLVYGTGSWDGMGYEGIPLALSLQRWYVVFVLIAVSVLRGDHKPAWHGWSLRDMFNLEGLCVFLKLGVPSGLTYLVECTQYEVLTLMAGYLPEHNLAAQTIVSQVYILFFYMYYGVAGATGYIVGSQIGAGNVRRARRATFASLLTTFLLTLCSAAVMAGSSDWIAHAMSSNHKVQDISAKVMKLAACVHIIDAFQCDCTAVLLACGLSKRSMVVNFVNCSVAVPLAYAMCLPLGVGIDGVWLGLLCGVVVASTLHITYFIWFLDWPSVVEEAAKRSEDERARKRLASCGSPASQGEPGPKVQPLILVGDDALPLGHSLQQVEGSMSSQDRLSPR